MNPTSGIQEQILQLYKNSPECSILFELMTDFDEGLQEWRYRHIKLVERTIGAKTGTGGSPGVPFLQQSLFKPVFHDLLGDSARNVNQELSPPLISPLGKSGMSLTSLDTTITNQSPRNSRAVPESSCAFSSEESSIDSMSSPGFASPNGKG